MAGIDVGNGSNKRNVNSELNMVPFIDLLMVTIAFLLITAVWANYEQLPVEGGTRTAGGEVVPVNEASVLHVYATDQGFSLSWKRGATVISERDVERPQLGKRGSYQALGKAIKEEWKRMGQHNDPQDGTQDRCVVHPPNAMPFREMVAMMDAVLSARRELRTPKKTLRVPAFAISMANK